MLCFVLDLLVTRLDFAVDDECWISRDKVGALALCTVHKGVLNLLLLEVVLLLCAPWARVRAVHGNSWSLGRLVHWWRWRSRLSTRLRRVGALGALPPLPCEKA